MLRNVHFVITKIAKLPILPQVPSLNYHFRFVISIINLTLQQVRNSQ